MKLKIFYILFIALNSAVYAQTNTLSIPFKTSQSNLLHVNVLLNNSHIRLFIFDTGASGIAINSTLFSSMLHSGDINKSDIIGKTKVIIADGSTAEASIIQLKSISIGGYEMKNMQAFVMPDASAPLLIGQSIFRKFGKISIDYNKEVIELEEYSENLPSNLSINEIRIIPCDAIKQNEVLKLKHYLLAKKDLNIAKVTVENKLPPLKAVNSIKYEYTIRYFDNGDYNYVKFLNDFLESDYCGFVQHSFQNGIENMLPYFNYKSIPSYIEIWIKDLP